MNLNTFQTRLESLVFEMLTENTGRHPLDSGGHYGRNWERNNEKTLEYFKRQPLEEFGVFNLSQENLDKEGKPRSVWIDRTVNLFPFLTGGNLQLDDICDDFNSWADGDWSDESEFYGVTEGQHEMLKHFDVEELYTFNTYNGDSDLSQILQGSWVKINDNYYVILQIHGGCDARGGYTTARLFEAREESYLHEYCREYLDSCEALEELVEHDVEFYCYDTKEMKRFSELTPEQQEILKES